MVNIKMEFKHPKYYKELRKRNKLDQAISKNEDDGQSERASDPGHKPQAASSKPQAPSHKLLKPRRKQAVHPIRTNTLKLQATSFKPQAASIKLQAASDKLPNPRSFIKFQAASIRGLD